MGCDIHLYTEARNVHGGDKTWFNTDNWRLNRYYSGNDEDDAKYEIKSAYRERNDWLFTTLAGVRDYSEQNKPIVEPRGLPEDVTPIVKAESDAWDSDGHTHSWLSLFEITEYAKTAPKHKVKGLVSPEAAAKLDAHGDIPQMWCQGTSDKTWVWREWEDNEAGLAKLIQALEERARDIFWVFDENGLTDEHRKNFRIVFWFDN